MTTPKRSRSYYCQYCNRPIKTPSALLMHERHCKSKPKPREGSDAGPPDAKEVIEEHFSKVTLVTDKPLPVSLSSGFMTLVYLRGELRRCETRAANLRKLIDTVEKTELMAETY